MGSFEGDPRKAVIDRSPMKKLSSLIIAIALGLAVVPSFVGTTITAKAEDDFTLVQVADGVYAAIAKSGGLASGNS